MIQQGKEKHHPNSLTKALSFLIQILRQKRNNEL